MKAKLPSRKYTAEFKREAVRLVLEKGQPSTHVARNLEISAKTLGNWLTLARRGDQPLRAAPALSEIEAENSRLRRDVARLKMECDILKKATAYFAKDTL